MHQNYVLQNESQKSIEIDFPLVSGLSSVHNGPLHWYEILTEIRLSIKN